MTSCQGIVNTRKKWYYLILKKCGGNFIKMIRLLREDGIEILLNTNVIQKVEADEERRAVITLVNGEIVKVKNPVYDVTQKSKAYLKGLKDERREYEKKPAEVTTEKKKEKPPEKGKRPRKFPGSKNYRNNERS